MRPVLTSIHGVEGGGGSAWLHVNLHVNAESLMSLANSKEQKQDHLIESKNRTKKRKRKEEEKESY